MEQKESYSGKMVVLSAGAINSAALLLRSANDKHPNGLANGSDVVGRHYMGHVNSVLMALSKCPNPTVFQKTLSVNDFYHRSPDWEFPMGHISFVGKLDGDTLKAGAPKVAPKWTLDLMGKHSLDFWLTSEDLPDPNNRVTINRDGEIVLQYKPNNEEGHKRLIKKLEGSDATADEMLGPRTRVPRRPRCPELVPRPAHSACRSCAPKRHGPFWRRSKNQRTRSQLQSARAR